MRDFDWNNAVDKKFEDTRRSILETLNKLVERVITEEVVSEEKQPGLPFDDKRTLTLQMIPNIPVSEIGWSSVATPETGRDIPSEQRSQLMGFLQNIKGEDLKDKLQSLDSFYAGDDQGYLDKDSNGKAISAALSYLTFYKTLTTILTNFNAASAGFSFESFLAVLLDGQQVPTGEGTIADLIAGDGTPISLKLYKEGNLEVGGSFTDLSRDLRKTQFKYMMQYVAVTKALSGDGLEQEGVLNWYRFNFNLDNVFNIISRSSKESQKNILLPKPFMDTKGESVEAIPEKALAFPSSEEMEDQFYEIMDGVFTDERVLAAIQDEMVEGEEFKYETLKQLLDFAKNDDLFVGKKIRGKDGMAKRGLRNALFGTAFVDPQKFKRATAVEGTTLYKVIAQTYTELVQQNQRTELQKKRQETLNELYFWDGDMNKLVEASVDFYNNAPPELKLKCLEYAYGYVSTGHFNLTQGMVLNIETLAGDQPGDLFPSGQSTVGIGRINIGAGYIQTMLDDISARINSSVFDIFDNLSILTNNVQGYFAGGLMDDAKADNAIEAANNIETKTREVATKEK